LAAGFGSRLESATGELKLKPLLPVAGRPLILRVIDGMLRVGCSKIVVVTGFAGEELRQAIRQSYDGAAELVFVDNPNFRLSNGLSVYAAREHLTQSFILSMADHVVSPKIMDLAAQHAAPSNGATLLVDRKIAGVFDLDDATKVKTHDGKIVAIGKQLTEYDCIDTGVFVCTAGLVEAIAKVAEAKGDASLSEGVQALAGRGEMEVLDVGDAQWMDVDTPEMLADAEARLR
jgi:choline kinase